MGIAGSTTSAGGSLRIKRRLRLVVCVSALAAVVSLVLEFGFYDPPLPAALLVVVQLAAVAAYVGYRAFEWWAAAQRWPVFKSMWIDGVVLAGACLFLLGWAEFSRHHALKLSTLYVATIQGVLVSRLVIEGMRLNLLFSRTRLHPTRVVVLTFVTLIVLGTIALSLPKAVQPEVLERTDFSIPRHVLSAALTATSATCVTGLIVYDTGQDLTRFGQCVILVLIQAGGLGIMIFGSAFALLATRRLSLRQSLVLQDTLSHRTVGHMRAMVAFIVIFTFTAEAIGTLMLYPMWDPVGPASTRWFHSIFHAVSAFCNAGFSLQTDSLIAYNRSWQVCGCFVPLIILGGLGFPVLHDLWHGLLGALGRRRPRAFNPLAGSESRRPRLSLHSKLVLITSAVLIVVPTLLFLVFESLAPATVEAPGGTRMADAPFGGRLLDSFFYAVTCRTAGFNTVSMDTGSMSPASHFLGVTLMFIGGAPASTAGGVKTVGIAVLVLGVWSLLRGREDVEVMGRTIPAGTIQRAGVLVILMFSVVCLVTLALCFTEQASLREALFEAVSACGTVGLSTGLTPDLTAPGRIVIMIAMFAGRLGPLTVLIALAGRAQPPRYTYPEEQVSIG